MAGGKKGTAGSLMALALAGGAFGISALFHHKKKTPTPPSGSVFDTTVPPLIPPVDTPPPDPLVIPNTGGASFTTVSKITGVQNVANPYGPIPRAYGTMVMRPPLAAQFVSLDYGQDNYGLALFCLGYGELVVSNITVGNKPISSLGTGVAYQVLPGTTSDPVIKPSIYSQNLVDNRTPQNLTYNKYVQVTTPAASVSIQVDITFPNGLYLSDSQARKSAATVNLDVFYRDTTTVVGAVASTNSPAAGSNVDILTANTTGIAVGQFVTVVGGGNFEFAYVSAVVTNTKITVAALTHSYTTPALYYNQWTKVVATTATQPSIVATDNAPFPIKRTLAWETPGTVSYYVTVVRTTQDAASQSLPAGSKLTDTCQWTLLRSYGNIPSITQILDQKGSNVGIAYIALKLLASNALNGQIGNLSCTVQSKLSTFDGASWTAPVATNNPAWILADILTGTANKRPVTKSQLDGTAFKAWADYCSANARAFNYIYDSQTTVVQAAREVATAGRASVQIKDASYSVVVDQPKSTVVQLITPRNSWGFHWTLENKVPPQGFKIRFLDATSGYTQAERIAYDDGYNGDGTNGLQIATKFESLNLIGCTDPSQAWKDGRYAMAVARLRRRRFAVSMDPENLACNRFDLVQLSHDTVLTTLGYGRIKSVTLDGSGNMTAVTCDELFTQQANNAYTVRFRITATGTVIFCAINTTSGVSPSFILTNPIPVGQPMPAVDDIVTFGLAGTDTLTCLVDSIEPQSQWEAVVRLVEYQPGVYNAESSIIPAWTSGVNVQHVAQQSITAPAVSGIITDERVLLRDNDGSYASRIQLAMVTPNNDVDLFESQSKPSDAVAWGASVLTKVNQGTVYVTGVQDGRTYDVRVRNITHLSYVSDWTTITGILVIGKTTPPPDVPRIDLLSDNKRVAVYYDTGVGVTVPLDFAGIRVKYNLGANQNWNSGTLIANLAAPGIIDISAAAAGPKTFMFRAVDVAGNESVNAAILLKDFGQAVINNLLLTDSHAPAFTKGTITNGTVSGGVLTANTTSSTFWSGVPTQKFWTGNRLSLFWTSVYQQLTYDWIYQVDGSLIPISTQKPTIAITVAQKSENFSLLFRRGGASKLFWNIAAGGLSAPFWTGVGTNKFWTAKDPLAPFPGQIAAAIEAYEFQAITSASRLTRGSISQLDQIFDVVNVTETINNFTVSSGGTRLPLTKTYRSIVNVQVAVQQSPSYPTAFSVQVVDKGTSGPLIAIYDKTGVQVAGNIDAVVQGY